MNSLELFGSAHLIVVFVTLVLVILVPWATSKRLYPKRETLVRSSIAGMLWINEISMWVYRLWDGSYTVLEHLPLHLCGFSIILCPIMLMKKNHNIYDLVYFWGLGGASQAFFTPTIEVGFPSFLFFQYFISHGLIILSVVYATVILKMRPSLLALSRTTLITLGLLLPIGVINWLVGSNYFFINGKPETSTLLDLMGPWPIYIVPLIGTGIVAFLLVYLPFPLYRKFRSI